MLQKLKLHGNVCIQFVSQISLLKKNIIIPLIYWIFLLISATPGGGRIMLRHALFCLFVGTTLGYVDKQSPPQWNPVYTVRGMLSIPYAELSEPFYTWYDAKNAKSRIDYYGGMVKTFQLTASVYPPFGTNIKIAPVTTEQVLNQETCLQVNGSTEMAVNIQPVLPDMTDFKYIGNEAMRDSDTAKWRMVVTNGDKVNKYTMWVKFKKTLRGDTIPIPVRYEMKGYNSLLGSHYDHYFIDYSEYDVSDIDQAVFNIDASMKCTSFPGPGKHHLATFNPMKEFVHPASDEHVEHEFNRFKLKHGKTYASDVEHLKRKELFRQNLRFIHSNNRARRSFTLAVNHLADRTDDEIAVLRGRQHTESSPLVSLTYTKALGVVQNLRFVHSNNRARRSFTLAVNHLADRTDDEIAVLRGRQHTASSPLGLPFPYSQEDLEEMSVKLPPEFDWRIIGAVTPVKDQSVCGSCWSFGTVGAVEGALFLHNGGHLVRLSQQALVDCSWGFGNNGCDGGEDFRAYQWIMKHGLPTEDEYGGYLGQDGYCHIDNVTLVTSMKGWVNVTAGDQKALMLALFKHGPISVAIDASHRTFSFYSHGVYYEPKCNNNIDGLDHAVLAVGYGVLAGQHYWLVKNSWSNLWGNQGYVLMASRDNNCGVMTAPTYVLM